MTIHSTTVGKSPNSTTSPVLAPHRKPWRKTTSAYQWINRPSQKISVRPATFRLRLRSAKAACNFIPEHAADFWHNRHSAISAPVNLYGCIEETFSMAEPEVNLKKIYDAVIIGS